MFRFPDPTPIMSQLQSFSIKKRPLFPGVVFPSVSGKETSILNQAFPLWEFELTYEGLRTQTENITPYDRHLNLIDYEKILAVFLTCKGQYGRFFFRDIGDYSRIGQIVGTADGSKTRFRIVRAIGSGALSYPAPVGGVDLSVAPVVKINGIEQVGNWTIDSTDLQTLVFDSAPGGGTITMDFYFFYYCRFLNDIQDFGEFMYNIHNLQGLKFRSTKDCAVDAVNPYILAA